LVIKLLQPGTPHGLHRIIPLYPSNNGANWLRHSPQVPGLQVLNVPNSLTEVWWNTRGSRGDWVLYAFTCIDSSGRWGEVESAGQNGRRGRSRKGAHPPVAATGDS